MARLRRQSVLHYALATAAPRRDATPSSDGSSLEWKSSIRSSREMSFDACASGTGRTSEDWGWPIKKGATAAPFFLTGEVSLPFLAGLLLPALGFLRHCLLSPPSCGFRLRERPRHRLVAAAWHAHPDADRPSLREHLSPCEAGGLERKAELSGRARTLTRDGLSWPPSYQM